MIRLTVVEIPMAQGLGFTAIRSGTGIGVEVSTSGGSLRGKKTSWMLSHKLDQMGFSSNVLPIRASRSSIAVGHHRGRFRVRVCLRQ